VEEVGMLKLGLVELDQLLDTVTITTMRVSLSRGHVHLYVIFVLPMRSDNQAPKAPAEDGMMRCNCDLEAKFGVASKEGPNKGRKFW
jgi:hypothetical protein